MAEILVEKEPSGEKSAYKTTQEEKHSDLLELDKHEQEMAGIKTIEVKRETISKIVELPAELDFDRTKIISINSPIDGKVIKVNCNQGDIIKQGDILAEIENPQTIGQIFKVNTQFQGLITRRNINPTVWVTRGSILFELVDTSKLWGVIHVYQEETSEIKAGQKVLFVVSDSLQSLAGEINYISPSIDQDTRTIEARAIVDNPGNFPAHTYAIAQITTDEKIHAVVIPGKAVFPEDFGKIVFTMDKNTFKKRAIETGIKRDGKVEVLQGLEEGDLLVIEGAYQLKNFIEYATRGLGRITNLNDLYHIAIATKNGVPLYLKDIATIKEGGQFRRGLALIDNKEVVTSTVTKHYGVDTMPVIHGVKKTLREIQSMLPSGVEIKAFFDQSELINLSIRNLKESMIIGGIVDTENIYRHMLLNPNLYKDKIWP